MRALPDQSFADVVRYVRMLVLHGYHDKMICMHLAVTFGPETGFLLYRAACLFMQWFPNNSRK
jgi:hypothetical protein